MGCAMNCPAKEPGPAVRERYQDGFPPAAGSARARLSYFTGDPRSLRKGKTMHSINRTAIVVRPKVPFFDWARSLASGLPESMEAWTSVYLVPADETDEPDEILRTCFHEIFQEQLTSWH